MQAQRDSMLENNNRHLPGLRYRSATALEYAAQSTNDSFALPVAPSPNALLNGT